MGRFPWERDLTKLVSKIDENLKDSIEFANWFNGRDKIWNEIVNKVTVDAQNELMIFRSGIKLSNSVMMNKKKKLIIDKKHVMIDIKNGMI